MFKKLALLFALVGCTNSIPERIEQSAVNEPVKIFIIAGQSNAGGHGNYIQLSPVPIWAQNTANGWDGSALASEKSGVIYPHPTATNLPYLYNSNATGLLTYQFNSWGPYVGMKPNANGIATEESWFGPELSFLHKYRMAHPTDEVAVLKQTIGGSSMEEWMPGYTGSNRHFLLLEKQINDAKARLTAAGKTYVFGGFIWVHGESGASSVYPYLYPTVGQEYSDKLRTFLTAVRNLTSASMPVIIGRNSDSMGFDNIIDPQINLTASNGINTKANLIAATNYRRLQQELVAHDPGNMLASADGRTVLQDNSNSAYWYHKTGRAELAYGEDMYAVLFQTSSSDAGVDAPIDSVVDAPVDAVVDSVVDMMPVLTVIIKMGGVIQPNATINATLNGNPLILPGNPGDTVIYNIN